MKVVLTQSVQGTGVKGEVKDVSPGFFRNFLMPRGQAALATPALVARLEKERLDAEQKAAELAAAQTASLKKINGQTVVITAKANEEGHLFAGISAEAIVAAIKEQKEIEVDPSVLNLDNPVKETGSHTLALGSGDEGFVITLVVKAEE